MVAWQIAPWINESASFELLLQSTSSYCAVWDETESAYNGNNDANGVVPSCLKIDIDQSNVQACLVFNTTRSIYRPEGSFNHTLLIFIPPGPYHKAPRKAYKKSELEAYRMIESKLIVAIIVSILGLFLFCFLVVGDLFSFERPWWLFQERIKAIEDRNDFGKTKSAGNC
jgi:hypothetical protein